MKEFIGAEAFRHDLLKDEYKNPKYKNKDDYLVYLWVFYNDTTYKVGAELRDWNYAFDHMMHPRMSKEERKKINKRLKNLDKNKPVNTSKWVKPDEETIKRNAIAELFCTKILKEGTETYARHRGRADVLYSILRSHSPKNPQILMNYANTDNPLEGILNIVESKHAHVPWKQIDKDLKTKKKRTHEDRIYNHWSWKFKIDKIMVKSVYKELPRKKSQKYIFKYPSKEKLEEINKEVEKNKKKQANYRKRFNKIVNRAKKKYGR